jgi:hypothetical protein
MMLLVWGTPVDGFTHMGPVEPNDPDMERWIETYLKDESWWYVEVKPPTWQKDLADEERHG